MEGYVAARGVGVTSWGAAINECEHLENAWTTTDDALSLHSACHQGEATTSSSYALHAKSVYKLPTSTGNAKVRVFPSGC